MVKGKQTPRTTAKPELTRNKLMFICMMELEGHYSLRAFTAGQNHQFGYLLPSADETPARNKKKYGRNSSTERVITPDSARPGTSLGTQQILRELGWEVLTHPPHNRDLAPSDFHLFWSLQNFSYNMAILEHILRNAGQDRRSCCY
ncbi:Histone-lysine N-methyltransferase SETMAR [Eumeta japonica]|uniref:Histone-lysine N-methyltransferase SETMAR n=1 Tax=Eumeta variegata TaxID=151549 RepID=A0A4C1X516_EUMVA|nr:Histone-lysine N-methyltransferase SETMAR [Eumeta japonica]